MNILRENVIKLSAGDNMKTEELAEVLSNFNRFEMQLCNKIEMRSFLIFENFHSSLLAY